MAKAKHGAERKLYRWRCGFGRMGDLEGLFVATEEEVTQALGIEAYFGEVLGKHSEIECELVAEQFEALPVDAAFVATFERIGAASGHNPLNYITCGACGDTLAAPYKKCGREACGWVRE